MLQGDPVQPGQPGRGGLHRLRLPRRRLPQQRRDHLRHAEALERAQGHHAAGGRRLLHEDRPHQGGPRARLRPAADLRPGHRRRLRVLHPEPRRRRAAADGAGARPVPRRGAAGPDARRRADAVARRGAAALGRRRPREGEGARRAARGALRHARRDARQLLRERLQQVRPHLAGADVGRAGVPRPARTTSARSSSEAQANEMVPLAVAGARALQRRPGLARPLQQPAGGEDLRPGRARRVLRARRSSTSRTSRRKTLPAELQLRLGRRLVPGEEVGRHLGPRARRSPRSWCS